MTGKELLFIIYKEFLKLIKGNSIKTWAKDINRKI